MTSTSNFPFERENQGFFYRKENPELIDKRENLELFDRLGSNYSLANDYLRNSANEEQAKYLAAVDNLIRDIMKDNKDAKIVYVFLPMYNAPATSYSAPQNNSKGGAYSHMNSLYSGKDAVASKYSGPKLSKGAGKGKGSYSSSAK